MRIKNKEIIKYNPIKLEKKNKKPNSKRDSLFIYRVLVNSAEILS